jgi:hypothetical protein
VVVVVVLLTSGSAAAKPKLGSRPLFKHPTWRHVAAPILGVHAARIPFHPRCTVERRRIISSITEPDRKWQEERDEKG